MVVVSGGLVDLGGAQTRRCEICNQIRQFQNFLSYRYWALYGVFGFVTERHYLVACEICGRGQEIEKRAAEAEFDRDPIPFMQRFGLLVLLAVLIGSMAVCSVLRP